MRVLALALLAAALLLVPSAAATPGGLKLLVRDGSRLTLVGNETLGAGPYRPLAFSGDGRLISIGGTIVGHVKLPAKQLAWSPTGERAAYVNTQGAVVEWTPTRGKRKLEPNGWGAQPYFKALAWRRDGALAVTRHNEIWVIAPNGSADRVVGSVPSYPGTGGPSIPVPFAWSGDRVLWWLWPDSGSVAADGVALYAGTQKLGTTLMYRDYIAVCGKHIAFTQGIDRYSTDGKSLVFDGRDVSEDVKHSWTEPSCTAGGRLVAAASRNIVPPNMTETHRALWQLLPTREQLTRPPWGWSDEAPHLFANGDLLFVRSRIVSKRDGDTWRDTQTSRVMLLSHGTLSQVAQIGYSEDENTVYLGPYYGHYDWSQFLAVSW